MATTKFSATTLRNKINLAVTHIGTTNGTKRPDIKATNRSGVAYDLAVAELVKNRAMSIYRSAVKAAIEAGIMFDHTMKPLLHGGIVKELFRDDVVRVYVKTKEPHDRLDMTVLRDIMTARHKIAFADFDAAVRASTKKTNPPHEFHADIVQKGEEE